MFAKFSVIHTKNLFTYDNFLLLRDGSFGWARCGYFSVSNCNFATSTAAIQAATSIPTDVGTSGARGTSSSSLLRGTISTSSQRVTVGTSAPRETICTPFSDLNWFYKLIFKIKFCSTIKYLDHSIHLFGIN